MGNLSYWLFFPSFSPKACYIQFVIIRATLVCLTVLMPFPKNISDLVRQFMFFDTAMQNFLSILYFYHWFLMVACHEHDPRSYLINYYINSQT